MDLTLKARHITTSSKVSLELERKMSTSSAFFSFQRCQIRSFQLHGGKIDVSIHNMFTGKKLILKKIFKKTYLLFY